jgi:peptide subunit release factor 1 (eRF1)
MREIRKITDDAPRKPNYAGWYGLRETHVSNRADELAKRHYGRVSQVLDELNRSEGYELLAVGGHDEEVPGFLEFLPRQLRSRGVGTFNVDPGTATVAQIQEKAQEIVDRFERDEERREVSDVLERAASGRPAAIGVSPTLWAASFAAIQTLLVQEGAVVPGVVCDNCGWLGESGAACIVCGNATHSTPDVIDDLVETVIDDGGTIDHVQADTELTQHLVAASLRFPVPEEPKAES